MRSGNTYTQHFALNTKQHEFLGLDLGEGVPRKALGVGLIAYLIWDVTLISLIGLPSKVTLTLYILPPGFVAYYGMRKSTRVDTRYTLTMWAIGIRYRTVGHRPIICGGRRAATRHEWIPRHERWGRYARSLDETPGGRHLARLLFGPARHSEASPGPAIQMGTRLRLYGADRVWRARKRHNGAQGGGGGEV